MKRGTSLVVLAIVALAAAILVACGGSSTPEEPSAPETARTEPTSAPSTSGTGGEQMVAAAPQFPTGPAVLVPAGYEPPSDRVDSTGAYLPDNGKPTLVFVDAIW